MRFKNAAIASAMVGTAMAVLVAAHPSVDETSASIPAPVQVAALEELRQAQSDQAEAARVSAEQMRHEAPAVLAARAEAERVAAEKAAAEKAAAEKAAAEKAAAQKAAADKAAAAKRAAQAPAAAAAPAPSRTADSGIAESAYTGPLYNPAYEATRRCIVRKESGGNYGVVSRNGLYFGAYQFSSSTGAATARRMGRPDLVGAAVNTWSRAEQDQAFWTLWNNGAGRGNWPTAAGC